MALAYDATRVTRDVDAMFMPHGVVLEEARAVAGELGLPPWWLNEQASDYVSGRDDPGKRRVFDHPGVRVMVASPDHIFAMKALAARTRDIDDLRSLAGLAKVDSVDAALQICRDFYPDETPHREHSPFYENCSNSHHARGVRNPALPADLERHPGIDGWFRPAGVRLTEPNPQHHLMRMHTCSAHVCNVSVPESPLGHSPVAHLLHVSYQCWSALRRFPRIVCDPVRVLGAPRRWSS